MRRIMSWQKLADRVGSPTGPVYFFGCLLFGTLIVLVWFAWPRTESFVGPPLGGINQEPNSGGTNDTLSAASRLLLDENPPIRFEDLAKSAGIHFKHEAGFTNMHYFPEIMGGGVAWLDYDQDGYMDLLLIQGGKFPPTASAKPQAATSRLFRNQGDGTFIDVTEKVGLLHSGYGQGVAVGDYDNDGYPDIFLSCFGECHLFHNESDGHGGRRFRDVTKEAGVTSDVWCSS